MMRRRWRRIWAVLVVGRRVILATLAGVLIGASLVTAVAALVKVSQQSTAAQDRADRSVQLSREVAALQRATTQQSVSARYEACLSGNRLRKALRSDVQESIRQRPLLFKLIPSFDTPEIRKLAAEGDARKLAAYADADCTTSALAVVPAVDRHFYHVP